MLYKSLPKRLQHFVGPSSNDLYLLLNYQSLSEHNLHTLEDPLTQFHLIQIKACQNKLHILVVHPCSQFVVKCEVVAE